MTRQAQRPFAPSVLARRLRVLAVAAGVLLAAGAAAKPAPKAKAAKPRGKAAAAPAAAAPATSGNPPIFRTVIHSEAYKTRANLGPHLNIKVTPPEKRGAKGRVLVELYNYSKAYVNVVDFWLYLDSDYGETVEVHIDADDIKPGWSALKWVQIPGNKAIPLITKVRVAQMHIFDDKAKAITLKYYTDLIKE
jgi:hypothetical protein